MSDRETIRQIIAEELARPAVQKSLADAAAQSLVSRIWEALRHPIVLTIAGFLLTATVGTHLERIFSRSEEDRRLRDLAIAAAEAAEDEVRASLLALTQLTHERSVRADLLRSAIRRDAASLVRRKRDYDAAYVAWNVGLTSHLMRLRQALANDPNAALTPSVYERLIIDHVTGPTGGFAVADVCLTDAFDARIAARTGDGGFVAPDCSGDWHAVSRTEIRRAVHCVDLILTDGLIVARHRAIEQIAEAHRTEVAGTARDPDTNLDQRCETMT